MGKRYIDDELSERATPGPRGGEINIRVET